MKDKKSKTERKAAHRARMKLRALSTKLPHAPRSLSVQLSITLIMLCMFGGTGLFAMRVWNRPTIPPTIVVRVPELTSTAKIGSALFHLYCAGCHGQNAAGTPTGPPLVLELYEPKRHSNDHFHDVISHGIDAHHWKFGAMPPVNGLRPNQRDLVIQYIRELQQANGIP